ncbi:MAG: bifunctional hydroxymethylpyrimidine kinase/phosphomethylpyrimidine kinase [Pyrinomonadaceae bacterium MAG19_C2-C3]|nr:bifunctional hydroxymethylpyrimidine kinase/phosphomethylpyrimidine kinase [Pyrinomonadaceae bacterium MAG19_C2-C3]
MKQTHITPPVALTIAGFDPSGGAGIVADIKTFTAFGFFATAAVTSLTFQNTIGVSGATHQTGETVRSQILPVVEDFEIACVKTGMLPSGEIIEEVARLFRDIKSLPAPVVDPVVRSTSGYDLIDDAALQSLIENLFPLARLITPNIPEAERITNLRIEDERGMTQAARRLREMGARAALVKGGHLKGAPVDVLLDDKNSVRVFHGTRIESTATHGTGCTLAAAIACGLGRKLSLEDSIEQAKNFVTEAIRTAPRLGHGNSPVRIK